MKKKNLLKELHIEEQTDTSYSPLDIDIVSVKQKVHSRLGFAEKERKPVIMKSKKRILVIAAAATMVTGATAFAATGHVSLWSGVLLSIPNYRSLPDSARITKDIGYEPVLIDTFKNGYSFKEGNIVKNNFADENSNVIEKFKSVSFKYEKNNDMVVFSERRYRSEINPTGTVISNVNGTDIYYVHYTDKSVPADYEMTEADKEAQSEGKLVFSYGFSDVTISEVQSVAWKQNGIQYQLMQIDGKLSADELAEMAGEAIERG